MIKEILMAVEERLKEVEELAYVDADWGQGEKQPPAVKFPAVLLGMNREDIDEHLGVRSFVGKYELSVKLLMLTLNRDDRYEVYDLVDQIKTTLHSKHIDGCFATYEGCQVYSREDGVKECVMNFSVTVGTMKQERGQLVQFKVKG
jgi:hypothetical protein